MSVKCLCCEKDAGPRGLCSDHDKALDELHAYNKPLWAQLAAGDESVLAALHMPER